MPDLVLRNIAPKLEERIQRLAQLQGFTPEAVALQAFQIGFEAYEAKVRKDLLNTREQSALKEAISEIQKVPDATFGLIGKLPKS